MGARVVGIDSSGIRHTDSAGNTTRLPTYITLWAAGAEASPLAADLAKATGAELDRAGRIAVLPDCSLPGHPEVFVVGDMMAFDGVAEVAMQRGLHAADTILRRLKGEPTLPFKYRDLGGAAAIGRFRAIVNFRGARLSRVPGLGRLGVRPSDFPDRVGQPLYDVAQVDAFVHRRGRTEREFSVMHVRGDLGTPAAVRSLVQPSPLPAYRPASQLDGPPRS